MAAKTTKKKTSIKTQAKNLAKSKYAPALALLDAQISTNNQVYGSGADQRKRNLDAALGSISASNSAAQSRINELKADTGSAYQQAFEKAQAAIDQAQKQRNQTNTNLLSSLQAQAQARGLSGPDTAAAGALEKLGNQDSLLNSVSAIGQGALQRQGLNMQDRLSGLQGYASAVTTGAKGRSYNQTQASLDELYNNYLTEKGKLEGSRVSTGLEQKDYENQTYLTLKDKAEQAKAAKAQAKLQSQIAAGNLSYKNNKLKIDTQYKYDKLASDTAQKDIANKLKAKGFSHKQAMDLANLAIKKGNQGLAIDKFNWSKANPKNSAAVNLSDLVASLQ